VTRDEALERAAAARVGRLATVRPDGTPHVVPFVFALLRFAEAVRVYWVVDDKPKRPGTLARIENLRTNPAAELLVDGYDEEWTRLWWVRLRGMGRVVESPAERSSALEALEAKYPQYRERRPSGEVVAIDVSSVASWAAS
jgi:PPOX class probable F420-dependent enzyme